MSEETKQYEQDACFYTWTSGCETVWKDNPRFYVERNGEMKIYVRHSVEDEFQILRYTSDLRDFGINTDADILAWEAKGEAYFYFDSNSWFEVCSYKEGDEELYEVYHNFDEAIAYAQELWNKYGVDGDLWK